MEEVVYTESIKKLTSVQRMVLIGTVALLVVAILLATQSYFSYVEVTTAANNCYDLGGYPSIEKSGFKMTYFSCEV